MSDTVAAQLRFAVRIYKWKCLAYSQPTVCWVHSLISVLCDHYPWGYIITVCHTQRKGLVHGSFWVEMRICCFGSG